jgi:hypothetical protein
MLRTIVAMARGRGIEVGLMTYNSLTSPIGVGVEPMSDARVAAYVREAARDLASSVPDLARLGFRIGETNRDAGWWAETFVAGVRESGSRAGLSTRTWEVPKAQILALVESPEASGKRFIVEAKYNGEQLGPPYVIAGGLLAQRNGYTYQDFLEPPAPYDFVFQIRSGGTHRIFRQASRVRIERTVRASLLGTTKGFSFEPTHAYFPQRDYYHARAEDRFSTWTFERDALEYVLFGRLGYDPTTDDRFFRRMLSRRVGTDALWDAMQAASEIVPWIQIAHTCGPDHRDYAPELEWGGSVAFWAGPPSPKGAYCANNTPFDRFAIASPQDTAADLLAGRATTRVSSIEVSRLVLEAADRARSAASVTLDPSNVEARDVVRECIALADLGDYFGHKLRAATLLAVHAGSADADYLTSARAEAEAADDAWRKLAEDTDYIAPFDDNLRIKPALGISPFHWREENVLLGQDAASIDDVASAVRTHSSSFHGALVRPAEWVASLRGAGPGLSSLGLSARSSSTALAQAILAADPPPGSHLALLSKPFSGSADWLSTPCTLVGSTCSATIAATSSSGAMLSIEVDGGSGSGWRYPDVLLRTPYEVVPPQF